MIGLKTIKVIDTLTRKSPVPKVLAQYDFNSAKPSEIFEKMLALTERLLEKAVNEGNPPEIIVLSPFLYRRYVTKFIEFILKLKKKYPTLKVLVVTRKPKHVNRSDEHVQLVRMLQNAGIYTRMKAPKTKDGREVPWHAKAIIIGAKYVIAGSINPLAPSAYEIIQVEPLVKVVENPGTWRTLRELLLEDENNIKVTKSYRTWTVPIAMPSSRIKGLNHYSAKRINEKRKARQEEDEGNLLYA